MCIFATENKNKTASQRRRNPSQKNFMKTEIHHFSAVKRFLENKLKNKGSQS